MRYLPRSGGKSTEFGAGDFISAAIGPRRTVGVHGRCSNPAPILKLIVMIYYNFKGTEYKIS